MQFNSFFKKGFRTWAVLRLHQDGTCKMVRRRNGDEPKCKRSGRQLFFDTLEARRVLDGALPSGIDQPLTDLTANLVSSVPENQTNLLLGTLDLTDADGGYLIDFGPLAEVLELTATPDGNELRYIGPKGFNFEEASSFTFEVRVFGADLVEPVLSKTFTVAISDQNDPPLGIDFRGELVVQEFVKGYEFGTIEIYDEDVAESYNYQVSDSRFEVADGKLKLKSDASLRYNPTSPISFEVVATGAISGDVLRTEFLVGVTLAPPPWQNKHWALDVNDDGLVTALDALIVINHMNRHGIGSADTPPPPGSPTFVDVNGDRFITPLDVLIIINFLNQVQGAQNASGSGEPGSGEPGSGEGSSAGEGEANIAQSPTPSVPSTPQVPRQQIGANDGAFNFDSGDIANSKRRMIVA